MSRGKFWEVVKDIGKAKQANFKQEFFKSLFQLVRSLPITSGNSSVTKVKLGWDWTCKLQQGQSY